MSQFPFEAQLRSGWAVLKRSFREFQDEDVFDWVSALTYYAVLSIFPVLLAVVSFVGLIGGPAVRPMMDNFDAAAPPGPVSDILFTALDNLQRSRGQAFVLFVVGLAAALWAATGYVGTFKRAANELLGTTDERQILKSNWVRLGVPFVVVALMTLAAVMVTFTGGPATTIGRMLGVGSTGTLVWNILKWPAAAVVVAAMLVILYRTAPTVRRPNYRGVTPGIAVATLIWLVASALFALYVAKFSAYNQTYAALAVVVIFLVWLWVTNGVVLLGVQFDIDMRRSHALEAGRHRDEEPSGETRDVPAEVGRARVEAESQPPRGRIHPS
ncbi:MAG: YihY/virulence factor BrkB family protein [Micromonosporaceae bacterium]|jgi:membrane protein|nr:YihY/virulence factor BrkB family protein [Micromonosporaceae bacterium]